MLYSLSTVALFFISTLNGQAPPNEVLITEPPVVNAVSTSAPITTEPPINTAAINTAAPGTTSPATTSAATTSAPVTITQAPVVVTPPSNPSNPTPPVQQRPQVPPTNPQFGPGFMPQMDPQYLLCEFGQCRGRRIVMSPGQGFNLKCSQAFQCDGLDLTLNVAFDPTNWGSGVSEINDLTFEAPTNGASVRINSIAPGNNVEVNNLYCKVAGSCRNLRVTAGFGVELWNMNVKCEQPGACTGCTVNGQSCEMLSMMHGNNNGFMPYGYGYTNTPNVPGQPQQQQPAVPQQPSTPQQPVQPQQPAYNPYYPYYQQPQYNPYNPYNPYYGFNPWMFV